MQRCGGEGHDGDNDDDNNDDGNDDDENDDDAAFAADKEDNKRLHR